MAIKKNPGVNDYSNQIDFAITTHCQAKCRSCARTNLETGEKESWLELKHMNLNVFKNTLNNSPDINLNEIEFCGELGDPMMHPQIDEFIRSALTYTNRVTISTNGGLRNPLWYETIAKKYGHSLEINWAIDGTTHDVNWKYREGVDWQRAMDNMTSYIKAGGLGCWWFIIFEWNHHQLLEASKMAKNIGIDIAFKYNQRLFGLITPESKIKADAIIKENGLLLK